MGARVRVEARALVPLRKTVLELPTSLIHFVGSGQIIWYDEIDTHVDSDEIHVVPRHMPAWVAPTRIHLDKEEKTASFQQSDRLAFVYFLFLAFQ